jgi:DNA-binding NarL/FixJ family response regulator
MNAFRILVADDHPVFRFGLCSLLGSQEGWEVCGEAADGRDAVQKCRQLKPDLLILDICMPKLNGVDAARQILRDNPVQRILVLTDVNSDQVVRDCLEMGVRGWVFKSEGTEDLTAAVEALQRHKCIFSPRVSGIIMDGYLQQHRTGPAAPKIPRLSPREREVVQLLGEGKTTKDVAVMLNVTVKTAETHRSNIMLKLKLHSIAELVLYAVRNEIVHVQLPAVLHFPSPGMAERTLPLKPLTESFVCLDSTGR